MHRFKFLIILLALFICQAEARRVNPELVKPPANNQLLTPVKPINEIRCTSCPLPTSEKPVNGRVWESEVRDLATWQRLSNHIRDTEYSKFVIDVNTNKIYFVDANVFTLHIDFVLDYLQKIPRTVANIKDYNQNYSTKKPQFILGYLTHYPSLGEWTFSFWEGDTIQAKDIRRAYLKLSETFTPIAFNEAGNKKRLLKFRPDSSAQERVAGQLRRYRIATINNDQLYKALPYQAFNTGSNVGKLVVVPKDAIIEDQIFNDDDIVLLQTSYPDISPVAGIITTDFSTPLSHVNLRASAWGIPNASIKNASQDYQALNGKIVFYEVKEESYSLREATKAEITQHTNNKQAKTAVTTPPADLNTTALLPLAEIEATDANKYGAKTSNLGEMVRAKLPYVNIPDGFGVPFSYYVSHLRAHGVDKQIDRMLKDPKFTQDHIWRKRQLEEIKLAIQKAPLDAKALKSIVKKWQVQLKGNGVFVRSSTNAEDLKGFNGAGLYDTVPNVKDEKALEAAIKKVWASIWNTRAVEERAYFGINHAQVYPAILIQTAVNAAAAGVLLTTDIWGHQSHTYTINAKWGLGLRVVEGQKIAEQILFDTSNDGTRVISRSDETTMLVIGANGGVIEKPVQLGAAILTEKRAKVLSEAAQRTAELFNQVDVLDIEWVLENKDGKDVFWLVQARPYVQAKPSMIKALK